MAACCSALNFERSTEFISSIAFSPHKRCILCSFSIWTLRWAEYFYSVKIHLTFLRVVSCVFFSFSWFTSPNIPNGCSRRGQITNLLHCHDFCELFRMLFFTFLSIISAKKSVIGKICRGRIFLKLESLSYDSIFHGSRIYDSISLLSGIFKAIWREFLLKIPTISCWNEK